MGRGTLQTGRVGRSVKRGVFNPVGSLQSGRVQPAGPASFAPEDILDDYWEVTDLSLADGADVDPWPGRNGVDADAIVGNSPTYDDTNFRVDYAANQAHRINSLASSINTVGEPVSGTFALVTEGLIYGANHAILSFGNSSNPNQFWIIGESSSGFRVWARGDASGVYQDLDITATLANRNVLIVRARGADGELDVWLNNTLVVDANTYTTGQSNTFDRASIGCLTRSTDSLFMSDGGIESVGFTSSILTNSQISDLYDYLTAVTPGGGS